MKVWAYFLSPHTILKNHSISNFMQQETFHKMCSNSSAKFLFTSSLFLNNKFHLTCWLYLLKAQAHSSKEKWHDIIITNIQPRETFFLFGIQVLLLQLYYTYTWRCSIWTKLFGLFSLKKKLLKRHKEFLSMFLLSVSCWVNRRLLVLHCVADCSRICYWKNILYRK